MNATEDKLVLTKQLYERYLDSLKVSDRKVQTIQIYRKCIQELYDYLPEDKEITEDTLEGWRLYLRECGYAENTINLRITAANGLMKFCGMKEYTIPHEQVLRDEDMPELTRTEYLQFLSAARRLGTEREYFLIKMFASVDIRIQELEYMTVESCCKGMMDLPDGRKCIVPPSLARELLDYAGRLGITSGMIFITRSGNPLDRSNIAREIRRLALEAGMDPEKCCPRALHRVYQTTQEELRARIMPIYLQTYDNMLNTEQALVAWQ